MEICSVDFVKRHCCYIYFVDIICEIVGYKKK